MIGSLAAILGSYFLGSWAIAWLKDQRPYQLAFQDITLLPGPPEWFQGGATAFLERVRERAREPQTIRVLALENKDVNLIFLHSPWVEKVVRINWPPRGLEVELQYRKPVALVKLPRERRRYLLDRSATILPIEDVDVDRLEKLGQIVAIEGENLAAPISAEPGQVWATKAGMVDIAPGNRLIRSAAQLASFLVEKHRASGIPPSPSLEIRGINPMDPWSRGLFILNAEDTWILWGEAPGEEAPGSLDAEQKWALLLLWNQQAIDRRLGTKKNEYWTFTRSGLHHFRPGTR